METQAFSEPVDDAGFHRFFLKLGENGENFIFDLSCVQMLDKRAIEE